MQETRENVSSNMSVRAEKSCEEKNLTLVAI